MAKPPGSEDRRALYLTLMILERFTQLPELLDFFGSSQRFLDFIDRFGGMTLSIPDRPEIAKLARDLHIYQTLSKTPHQWVVDRMADYYGLTDTRIRQIFGEVKVKIQRLDEESGGDTNRLIGERCEL